MSAELYRAWMRRTERDGLPANVFIYSEREGARTKVFTRLTDVVLDHLIGLDLLSKLGFGEAAESLRGRLPTKKRVQSGDLGEILGAVYIDEATSYSVPIKRLRHKPDRNALMPGTDLVGIGSDAGSLKLLKGEAKSRKTLYKSTVSEAVDQLLDDENMPSPGTLAFIADRLAHDDRMEEFEVIRRVQTEDLPEGALEHLVFTVSGNDPGSCLRAYAGASPPRYLVGLVVTDHQDFIDHLFEEVDDTLSRRNP